MTEIFFPLYFGITRRNISSFRAFFCMASVQSRSLDQPLVPRVFLMGVDSWEVPNVFQVLLFFVLMSSIKSSCLLDWVVVMVVVKTEKDDFFQA